MNAIIYFTDKECYNNIKWTVGANKVRCFRTNNKDDMCGFEVPYETQYAMKLHLQKISLFSTADLITLRQTLRSIQHSVTTNN